MVNDLTGQRITKEREYVEGVVSSSYTHTHELINGTNIASPR